MLSKPGTARLTKRTVDAARPRARRYIIWDRELKGFGLRVEAREKLGMLAGGADPAHNRIEKRGEMAISELYMREGAAMKKASTVATDKGRIKRHIKPLLGRYQIGSPRRGYIERYRDQRNQMYLGLDGLQQFGHRKASTMQRHAHLSGYPVHRSANQISGKISDALMQVEKPEPLSNESHSDPEKQEILRLIGSLQAMLERR